MRVIALLCGLVATTMVAFGTNASAQVDPGGEVSRQQYDAWMSELSNWGRWGADDQLGALNLITPAKRVAAARLVEEGRTVSMARAMTI
ncbi:MAG TPA: cyclase, partial [Gemmatimonadetes bacterium]|nr:cyclase [Gemmatimonadota bacterium]